MTEWIPLYMARVDGRQCMLRYRDVMGYYEIGPCFLHDDGYWYLIDPPTQLIEASKRASAFRFI